VAQAEFCLNLGFSRCSPLSGNARHATVMVVACGSESADM